MLFILLIAFAVSSFSQDTLSYNATSVAVRKNASHNWSQWMKCDVPVEFISSLHKINIFTNSPHFIDYGEVYIKKYKDYNYYFMYGTDTNYDNVKIEWYIYNSGYVILKIITKEFEFKYTLEPSFNYTYCLTVFNLENKTKNL